MLEIGNCILTLIFSVALRKHGEYIQPKFKTPVITWHWSAPPLLQRLWFLLKVDTVCSAKKGFLLCPMDIWPGRVNIQLGVLQ